MSQKLAAHGGRNSVRLRKQDAQVNGKSNIQEAASGSDEGCGSATSLVMAIVIGKHPRKTNMSDAYSHCLKGWAALWQQCFVH